MIDDLSPEQRDIVDQPLGPIAVTACAGSGKTKTAVYRLATMRQRHEGPGLVALLSFSNVAVDTFRKEYAALLRSLPMIGRSSAVEIDTMDGFITSNVLRPHGHRVMKCDRVPYLVEGREAFLAGFKVYDGKIMRPTTDIEVACNGAGFHFTIGRGATALPARRAEPALGKLASVGAYSHSAGRYWVLRVLREKPFVLRALARRYPHILIDEAQDIGPEHQAILQLLIDAGSQVSLIGDPHQGIYEFARADGTFLRTYGSRPRVSAHNLTVNYRSLPDIVDVANKLTKRADTAKRVGAVNRATAYYMPFKAAERDHALTSFRSLLVAAGIDPAKGVVLCRSKPLTAEWAGELDGQGIGVVRCFADAAISRDQKRNFHQAFNQTGLAVSGLLAAKHGSLSAQLARPADDNMRRLRQLIWSFVRDPTTGLPSAALVADSVWHPLLLARAQALIATMVAKFGFEAADNLGRRLAKTKLEARPLVPAAGLAVDVGATFRTSTVHKVKGESLNAVLYVAQKGHVRALLNGTGTEEGRIGYVALTRAQDLFVLAVPDNCLVEFEAELQALGLKRVGFVEAPVQPDA
ncbi:UvrD-helicase domain-containing protein [Neoroseomonas lacus]|uniref:DNA 3'-5' helicase II n=1 Tax=Neoroseomonas lacus TaxID=287609 RepID=A0A917NN35_9PROT|nr:ATP-dependent helicase [Neoroseomonas lacus]GGJ13117.1 DNA helicase [Neoroseomonas lacus]